MFILAIDTSCDETSVAILKDNRLLSNVIASQIDLHKKWGGVVPDIARRAHKENIEPAIKEALKRAHLKANQLDYIAVTYGPGLALALEVGINSAKDLARALQKPLIAVNHMEGHLLSSFVRNSQGNPSKRPTEKDFPAMGLLVSGGHTDLVYTEGFGKYKLIGETLDDAAGEAFDKLAKMLDLGYPGGPIISEFAKKGVGGKFGLPIPMEKSKDLNFSFSGLKTACLYKIKDIKEKNPTLPQSAWVYDFCAEFVDSVIKSLLIKLEKALDQYSVKSVLLGGGVISNEKLRRSINKYIPPRGIKVFTAYNKRLFTDNAAMIGIAAYYGVKCNYAKKYLPDDLEKLERDPIAEI